MDWAMGEVVVPLWLKFASLHLLETAYMTLLQSLKYLSAIIQYYL